MTLDSKLSRDSFLLAAELRLFWLIAALYAFSLILHLFHVITRGVSAGKAANLLLWAGALLHIGLITLRTAISKDAMNHSLTTRIHHENATPGPKSTEYARAFNAMTGLDRDTKAHEGSHPLRSWRGIRSSSKIL